MGSVKQHMLEQMDLDEEVAFIVEKLEGLPILRRRNGTALSHAFLILAAREARDEEGSREDFIGAAGDAWDLKLHDRVD